jgi:hypothetical protein
MVGGAHIFSSEKTQGNGLAEIPEAPGEDRAGRPKNRFTQSPAASGKVNFTNNLNILYVNN